MSDCMRGGRFHYAKGHGTPTGTQPDVMRGKVVFEDGTELPLVYVRNGRSVAWFEMDGVRYERAGA